MKATAANRSAIITVNNLPVKSGTSSLPIALSAGSNSVTIIVASVDGLVSKTYTVTVTRASYSLTLSNPDPGLEVGQPSVYRFTLLGFDGPQSAETTHALKNNSASVSSRSATVLMSRLPAGFNFVSTTGSGWACAAENDNIIVCRKVISGYKTEHLDIMVEPTAAMNGRRARYYASVGTEGDTPIPGPSCSSDGSAGVCVTNESRVTDITDKLRKAVEDDVAAFMATRMDRIANSFGQSNRLQRLRSAQCGLNHDGALQGDGTEKQMQLKGSGGVDYVSGGCGCQGDGNIVDMANCRRLNSWLSFEADHVAGRDEEMSTLGLASAGVEYMISPSLLTGIRLNIDFADFSADNAEAGNADISGTGWLAGPYFSAEVMKNVFFEGFVGYGTSWNNYSGRSSGVGLKGDFETQRVVGNIGLSGQWERGSLMLIPSLGATYAQEWNGRFEVSNSAFGDIGISSQMFVLGRLNAKLEANYRTVDPFGNDVTLMLAPSISYDFKRSDEQAVEDIMGDAHVRGGIEAAARYAFDNGMTLDLSVGYEGLGADDWAAYKGEIQFGYSW